jgi:hypothetical protein
MDSSAAAEKSGVVDRVVAAAVAALTVAVMIVLGPLVAFFVTGLRGMYVSGMSSIFEVYSMGLIWAPVLMAVSAIAGAILGTRRVVSMFGYLWGTEEPKRPFVTAALWLAVVGIGVLSVVVTSAHHAL